MQSHRVIVILAGHVIERTHFDYAGVVDQDINPVEAIDDFPNRGMNLIAIEQIAFNGKHLPAAGSEIGLGAREFFWVTREESNLAALIADVTRQHEPESTRPATDQSNFVANRVLRRATEKSGDPTANYKSPDS